MWIHPGLVASRVKMPATGRLPAVAGELSRERRAASGRAHGLLWCSRWLVIAMFVFASPAGARASASESQPGTSTATTPSDKSATQRLLEAEYQLAKAELARDRATEAAAASADEALGRQCRGALRGVPNRAALEEEGPLQPKPRLSGRIQGEQARSELEERTIDMEIDQKITAADSRVLRGPYDAYIATANRLSWSDQTITALVHQKAARLREELTGPPVKVCAEMRAWAAGGFHRLPPGSKSYEEARQARETREVDGDLEKLLRPYESPAGKALVRRTEALAERRREEAREDSIAAIAAYNMELALGEKPSRFFLQLSGPVIDSGRTHAGTRFVIRATVGKSSSRGSCKHEVQVEIRNRRSGSGTGVCLGERAGQGLSGGCSGPVETLQFATPPDVRQVRVRLSNGRTVTDSVVQIPVKDGGPAGLFVDAFRGYKTYPVSAQELSSDGRVLRTVGLRGMRCEQEPGGGEPEFFSLATVLSPYGEPLNIEASLVHFEGQTAFDLIFEPGVHSSHSGNEGQGKPKQFPWNLSTECAPHPYSLLDGILSPPGASVLARTPAGLAPLTKVELAPSMHAEGPLFYGIYTTPPTEIVVERADGTILYSESLAAQATEATQFCEGYAEQ